MADMYSKKNSYWDCGSEGVDRHFPFLFLQVLRNAMLFLILAPYDNEQSDLIHRVSEEKTLDGIPLYRYRMSIVDFSLIDTVWVSRGVTSEVSL